MVPNGGGKTYAVVDDVLVSRIVVDVDCDAAEGGDFGGELGEAAVVLSGGWWLGGVRRWGVEGMGRVGRGWTYCSRSYAADMMGGWMDLDGCVSVCVVVVTWSWECGGRDACGGYVLKLHACVH